MTSGVHKSAILLATLGTDLAAQVLAHMEEREVEILVREMARLGHVRADERDRVLEEFRDHMMQDSGAFGGMEVARKMLEQAVGEEKAQHMIEQLEGVPAAPPLSALLTSTSVESLAALVADEHPQLIALLIGQLPVEQAAGLLAALPVETQGPVAARLAEMEAPSPVALAHLERCLMEKMRVVPAGERDGPGGPRRVAEILGQMRRSAESAVLDALERQSPEVAEKVNRYRFSFEHLLKLDGRALQRLLRDVEPDTLRLAMKGLDEQQQQLLYANMSERAAAALRDDLEATGPVRLRDVETAQQQMVAIARGLAQSGEIQIDGGPGSEGDADVLV